MSKYAPVSLLTNGPGPVGQMCVVCGVLVESMDTHDLWHRELDAAIRNAARFPRCCLED